MSPKAKIAAAIGGLAVVGVTAVSLITFQRNQQIEKDLVPIPVGQVETAGGGETAATGGETAIAYVSGGPAQLVLNLSEGQDVPDAVEPIPVVGGEPLPTEVAAQITARLPEMPAEESDVQEVNLPDDPIPPPRPGKTIDQPFPPPPPETAPPDTAVGPLEVIRYSPEGEVDLAPFLSVTFNQPMVPLGTLEALAAEDVPVKLTPEL
ncbi:MAG TPA: hypothetical protein EYP41_02305, partial [Anaerolineae bacterium]|nr:hypothetical protein [Anaerolineae bacterium]HIP70496.1 hypothetical protein [Anaerolineae bacterium]